MLPADQYAKATDIMETIARTPQERQAYESRRKAEMDYRAGLDEAMALGVQKGRDEGERLGLEKGERLALLEQVRFLQGVLQVPLPVESHLQNLDLMALRGLCAELKDRLRKSR